ncbi:ribosome-binding factor A [Bacteriovorax sp. BSW11_IV]|uniref:30S ribosome-binding factor RbfA n=1 Tax=Bacteriovorax sp. BSW11_IV TaxID=1353529 RepID=UPI00038A2BCB|nr:30S ribosome-binding factor RbfA [Bacteriovorax sp. BSW11_IV]EQC49291.1 ribosome-binding factor A [Bacteriovorax sp. BSW11_IV]
MAKKSFKKEKYTERLVLEINSFLRTGASDPRLSFLSVTKVEMSVDYSYADIYWDTFDISRRGDCKKAIEAAAPKIRSQLAKVLQVRQVPELRFVYDSQFVEEQKISDLLNSEKELGKSFSDDDSNEDEE